MRTEVWNNIGGFIVLSWLVWGLGAAVHAAKAQEWVQWACAVTAAALSMTAGAYVLQATWIEDLVVLVAGLHPVLQLLLGLGLLAGLATLAMAVVPNRFLSTSLTAALVIVAFWAPVLAAHTAPGGKVGATLRDTTQSVSASLVHATSGWFA